MRQGPHQVAQKFKRTTFPRNCERLTTAPSRSGKRKSGASSPMPGTFHSALRTSTTEDNGVMADPATAGSNEMPTCPPISRAAHADRTSTFLSEGPWPSQREHLTNGLEIPSRKGRGYGPLYGRRAEQKRREETIDKKVLASLQFPRFGRSTRSTGTTHFNNVLVKESHGHCSSP